MIFLDFDLKDLLSVETFLFVEGSKANTFSHLLMRGQIEGFKMSHQILGILTKEISF